MEKRKRRKGHDMILGKKRKQQIRQGNKPKEKKITIY